MSSDLSEAISALRLLNQTVLKPRRLPSESEARDTEQRSGVVFHADFHRYLMEASDVVFGVYEPVTISGGHTQFGVVLQDAREAGVPDPLIPICADNGDYYCMSPDGVVVYWSHNGTTDERWPSLAEWILEVWIGGN